MACNWYNLLEGGSTAESLRHFTTVTSDFYPDLFKHYDALHEAWVQAEQSDTEKNDARQLPGSC